MQSIWQIIRISRSLRAYYVSISAITVALSIVSLLLPLFTGWAIDEMRKGTDARVSYVVWLAIGIFLVDLSQTILNNVGGYLGDQMSQRLQKLLSYRYYQHVLSLPQQYFDQELSGKIINRLSRSITQITNFMQMMSNNFLQFIVGTVLALGVVFYYSWQVGVLLFSLYPIYIWMTVRTSNTWQEYQAEKNLHNDIASGRFAEAVSQVKVVKSFNQERQELAFFRRHLQKVVTVNRPQSRYWHVRDVQRRLVLNVIFFAVYLYIFVAAVQGQLSPGQAVALVLYAQQIRIPIFTISFLVENTQRAIADSKDYFEIMDLAPSIADKPGAKELRIDSPDITFNGVTFGYDSDSSVLRDIDLRIQPSQRIALVGESGEGKTTLTNLLLRLYEPQQGMITIDGHNIAEVTQASLRSQIGVVFQEPALFSGTIRENIAYAHPDASEDDVIAAAKAANAHEFISVLPEGYETQIGERGLRLSGGQKQRIAIARALLKDAPILILDEATSSLDNKSERMVQQALERLMAGRTTIIIAHRLTTIEHVDTIVTLKGGKINEVGSPAELANSGGIYAQLLNLQRTDSARDKKRLAAFDIATT